jgi:hypothetical protein
MPIDEVEVAVDPLAQLPPMPTPDPGMMWIRLTMNTAISEEMAMDMMRDITDNLQTVTHMVNYAEFDTNVNGTILTYEKEILPAIIGDPTPSPTWLLAGEPTVNA